MKSLWTNAAAFQREMEQTVECVCRQPTGRRSGYLVRNGVAYFSNAAMGQRLTKYGAIHARINELLFRIQVLEKRGKK